MGAFVDSTHGAQSCTKCTGAGGVLSRLIVRDKSVEGGSGGACKCERGASGVQSRVWAEDGGESGRRRAASPFMLVQFVLQCVHKLHPMRVVQRESIRKRGVDKIGMLPTGHPSRRGQEIDAFPPNQRQSGHLRMHQLDPVFRRRCRLRSHPSSRRPCSVCCRGRCRPPSNVAVQSSRLSRDTGRASGPWPPPHITGTRLARWCDHHDDVCPRRGCDAGSLDAHTWDPCDAVSARCSPAAVAAVAVGCALWAGQALVSGPEHAPVELLPGAGDAVGWPKLTWSFRSYSPRERRRDTDAKTGCITCG